MSEGMQKRVKAVFSEAAEKPAEERAAYLDEACKGDRRLRNQVEGLLAALQDAGDFLDAPPSADPADGDPGPADGDPGPADGKQRDSSQNPPPIGEGPGARIGRYKILQLIGEGGFGMVYMAEQEEPVRRRVALKIIKLGMDTKQVIARFEAERQALAMMDHPNIARVFDAGATKTGRPFFVMELVKGIPITEYCDKNNLSARERLDLFMSVCRAVQHAHQKGIIHRDIKPTNVLVTLHDGVPVPKVIDFGIAKAMHMKLTERTLFTEYSQFIGTPAYMSPEQAEMSGLDVDTRSDIYALGVLLYELLTGTTPFDPRKLRSKAYDEIQRMIRDVEPDRPSTRLSTLGESVTDIAKHRRIDARGLSRLIKGDLDWITMKALEKDRTRRYETANGLALDIERYMRNDPVAAGPPGPVYRFRKFFRRNRTGVLAGSLIAVAILLGLVLASIGFVQAREERNRAIQAEAAARQETEAARTINTFYNNMLAAIDPEKLRWLSRFAPEEEMPEETVGGFARDVTVAQMLRFAKEQAGKTFEGKPELEAGVRENLAMTLLSLGLAADALSETERAYEIRRTTLGADHSDTLRSRLQHGYAFRCLGRFAEAEPLVRGAVEGASRIYGPEHPKTLGGKALLARIISSRTRYEESEPLFEETLEAQLRLLGPEHRDTLDTMANWAVSCFFQGKFNTAYEFARKLHNLCRRTLSPEDPITITAETLKGWSYIFQDRYDQARALLLPTLEKCHRIFGEEHMVTFITLRALAKTYRAPSEAKEKERLIRQVLAGLQASVGEGHRTTVFAMSDLASLLEDQGRFTEAEPLRRALVDRNLRFLPEDHVGRTNALQNLAFLLDDLGRYEESAEISRQVLAALEKRNGPEDPETLNAMNCLAWSLIMQGNLEEAERLVTKALEDLVRVCGKADSYTVSAEDTLAELYYRQGRWEESEALFVKVIRNNKEKYGSRDKETLDARCRRGRSLTALGRFEEAEEELLVGIEGLDKVVPERNSYRLDALKNLIDLYEAWEKPALAEKWRKRLQGGN